MLARVQYATDDTRDFEDDVLTGLARSAKRLSCRWLYDDRGSELFEAITVLPEYYPTRVETALLRARAADIAAFAGKGGTLIEYGAGAGIKTEILLGALEALHYVPIDVAHDFLALTAKRLRSAYPHLEIAPVVADFNEDFDLPLQRTNRPRLAFFPGSTIGNLDRVATDAFLRRMRGQLGAGAKAVIGVDLVKDPAILVPAYDDAAGVTAAFNLNLLARINRELDGGFDLGLFEHRAVWNDAEHAIEMRLVSLADQVVHVAGRRFDFTMGETIHTESSRKYTPERFIAVADTAGWDVAETLIDDEGLFSVYLLEAR